MAYGLKYTGYKQRGTDRVTVNIYAKDWTGTTYELATLTGLSLQIQGAQGTPYSPLIKTSVAIALRDAFDEGSTASDGTTCVKNGGKWGQWEEFYTNDSTKFRVELKHGSTVIWKGYITPDSWGEDMTYRGVINLTARDMLGALSEKEFDLTGAVSIRDIVEGAMTAGEIPMAVSFEDEECPINSNNENILDATVQASVFGGKSWQEALERTLESTGLVLRYDGQGGFYVTSLRYAYSHATATVTPQFTGGSGYRSLDPAAKQIVDTFNPKFSTHESRDADRTRFLIQSGNFEQVYQKHGIYTTFRTLRKYQVSAGTDENGWRGDLATLRSDNIQDEVPNRLFCIPTNCEGFYVEYVEDKVFAPIAITLSVPIVTTGESGWTVLSSDFYSLESITTQIRAKIGNTVKYLNDSGEWVDSESSLDIVADKSFNIPTITGTTSLAIRIIRVRVGNILPYNPLVAMPVITFSAPEYTDLAGEYKTTTVYNEANHVEINRKPEIGSANTVLSPVIASNILAFDGVAAPDEWGFSDMNGHFPLAVLVQAQLLVFYAAQNGNSIFTGTFVQSDKRTALPGKNYTYYQRSCAMLAGTFDFINGTAQSVTLREIAQWSDIWESFDPQYTQKESSQTGGTAASGGGTSGGGGGQGGGGSVTSVALTMPTGFSVEGSPITRSGEFQVGFAEGYSLLTPEARAILDRFEYNATTHTLFVKKDGTTPVNFAAYGEVTAGGVGSGGDTPSGALYSLVDVSHSGVNVLRADGTARQNGDALVFNTTQNKWVASPVSASGGVSSVISLTGDITQSQLRTALGLGNLAYQPDVVTALGYTPYNAANIGSASVASANVLTTYGANGSSNLTCLQNIFSTVPKSVGTAVRLQHGSHSMALGWFLSGYDYEHAYGGWFISDYGQPSWVGVDNGNWKVKNFAFTSDIPTNNNQLTNGAGYITSSGSCAYATSAGNADTLDGQHGSYYAAASSLGNYLPLSGGTLSGTLTINKDSQQTLILNRTNGLYAGITFQNAGQELGRVGFSSANVFSLRNLDGNWKPFYHSGNCNNTSTPWSCSNLTASMLTGVSSIAGVGTPIIARNNGWSAGMSTRIEFQTAFSHKNVPSSAIEDLMNGSGTAGGTLIFYTQPKGTTNPNTLALAERMRISDTGNVSIGTTYNSEKLYVAGNIVATGEVTAGSDSRWKDNQTPVTNGIDIIRQLRPMTWTWNWQFADKNYIGKQSAGLIAQQVASVLPFAVRGNQENGYTLDYNVFHAYEISAIQSHETRIQQLERENAELKRQLQQLNS